MCTFQTYFILALVLLCTITDGHEAGSLPGAPVERVLSSHFLNMCELSHKECLSTRIRLKCTTCKVSCAAASLPEKAEECAAITPKGHRRQCAMSSGEIEKLLSQLRFAVKTDEKTDEQSGDLPSVVGRWSPDTCADTNTPCPRCCEHEYYWCHRGGYNNKCRHCVAAVAVCSNVPGNVAVFNSNLTGPKRAAIALKRLGTGICKCVPGFYC